MIIACKCIDPFGHVGPACDLLQCCCRDGAPIKSEKSRTYQITRKRKAARNLRRHGGAIFGRSLLALDQSLPKIDQSRWKGIARPFRRPLAE